jgi:hypothetical protein
MESEYDMRVQVKLVYPKVVSIPLRGDTHK